MGLVMVTGWDCDPSRSQPHPLLTPFASQSAVPMPVQTVIINCDPCSRFWTPPQVRNRGIGHKSENFRAPAIDPTPTFIADNSDIPRPAAVAVDSIQSIIDQSLGWIGPAGWFVPLLRERCNPDHTRHQLYNPGILSRRLAFCSPF